MPGPALHVRRTAALGLVAVLVAPLLGALHQHDVDHDGTTHHIEAAHGAHAPTLAETDSRLTSGGPKLTVSVVVATAPDLALGPSVLREVDRHDEEGPPPRAPPGTSRSRAPPA
jgi:hypothetical protein